MITYSILLDILGVWIGIIGKNCMVGNSYILIVTFKKMFNCQEYYSPMSYKLDFTTKPQD